MWHFCAALRAFEGYHRWIFARNFHKATRNADSSLDCVLCPASIFSQPPSADCILLWIAISSRLFSSDLLCSLTLCLLWDLPSLVFFWSRGRSRTKALCEGFAPKQSKRSSEWHQHKRKRRLPIVSHFGLMSFSIFLHHVGFLSIIYSNYMVT